MSAKKGPAKKSHISEATKKWWPDHKKDLREFKSQFIEWKLVQRELRKEETARAKKNEQEWAAWKCCV